MKIHILKNNKNEIHMQNLTRARKEKKKISTFCIKVSGEWKKKVVSAWNGFLLNVFNSMGYLRWWGKLFHAKEPEKEKLVLKISILVPGKRCLFPLTWRRSKIWDLSGTVGLCREQPFALEHICWVIVVCLESVVWEHSTFVCSTYGGGGGGGVTLWI